MLLIILLRNGCGRRLTAPDPISKMSTNMGAGPASLKLLELARSLFAQINRSIRNLLSPGAKARPEHCDFRVRGARSRRYFAENSGRPRPSERTARVLPAFGGRDESFALRLFPRCLACSSNGFCFLPSLALGRFFIGLAALHLAKNAFALHLLL
jgi:hypothetical protein